MKHILICLLLLGGVSALPAQEKRYRIRPKALDAGVYDYGKVKKHSYKIYYNEEAEAKFRELVERNDRLKNSETLRECLAPEEDESVCEYCPELNYVMTTGGHGYVTAIDLATLEVIPVDPSSHVYSPSGKYRFGSFPFDGLHYFIEVKEDGKYVSYPLFHGSPGAMTGVYWVDDETIHFLREREDGDGSKYWVGYSTKFYEVGGR